ncbi:hypothetical protein O6P43_031208, partial [Quillaja saponaria]
MKRGLFLYVVVSKGTAIFQLFPSKDQPLLVRGNAFLILDLGLNVVNSVGALNLQGDGLPGESLNKDLHPTTETE